MAARTDLRTLVLRLSLRSQEVALRERDALVPQDRRAHSRSAPWANASAPSRTPGTLTHDGPGYSFPVRAQPLINCRDVQASSRWYQRLLGCVGGHGGTEYERLWDPNLHTSKWGSDGLILQLHAWEIEHHHGPMADPSRAVGNGMLLWFEVDDFDAAVARARELDAPILLDVHRNPNANHRELWIRDPDGYTVVLASSDGDAKEA
jgi:catechol 2,3-dioxygenase-like lactoylglutathione lyase family enzyme